MQLRTSLKSYINLYSLILGGVLLLSPTLFAKEENKFPGIIESLESLINIDRLRFNKKNEVILKSPKLGLDFNKMTSYELDSDFIQSLSFHTDKRFITLMEENPCAIYALIEGNLARNASGEISEVMIKYQMNGQENFALVPKKEFLEFFYKNTCQDNVRLAKNYSNKFIDTTFSKLNLRTPGTENDCAPILKEWRKAPETPYICQTMEQLSSMEKWQDALIKLSPADNQKRAALLEKIQVASTLTKKIKPEQQTYFKTLCDNLGSEVQYCNAYFNQSYWLKIAGGQGDISDMEKLCVTLLQKRNLSEGDYKVCAIKLSKQNDFCHYQGLTEHSSLVPKPSCENISKALNYSRLYRSYEDCPYNSGNEGVIQTSRLLFHLSPEYRNNFVLKNPNANGCYTQATSAFAKLNLDFEAKEAWDLVACYDDKINDKEVCLPIIMGTHETSEYSEEKQIFKILEKTKGADKNTQCKIVSSANYNPSLLEFKYGCFLIYDPNLCSGVYCPKKILLNEREVNHITYHYGNEFDYFPSTIAKEKYAISGLLENVLQIPTGKITNVTSLRFFLAQAPTYVVHGMGCAEDLLPSFFTKTSFNQCTPLSFIVDGLIEKSGRAALVVRTALDDLHAPRLVDWNYVFSSVRAYQEYHPLKLWSLYVLKK